MDHPLLMLARDDLRRTLVFVGLVVIMVSAIVRKRLRRAELLRDDADRDRRAGTAPGTSR